MVTLNKRRGNQHKWCAMKMGIRKFKGGAVFSSTRDWLGCLVD